VRWTTKQRSTSLVRRPRNVSSRSWHHSVILRLRAIWAASFVKQANGTISIDKENGNGDHDEIPGCMEKTSQKCRPEANWNYLVAGICEPVSPSGVAMFRVPPC